MTIWLARTRKFPRHVEVDKDEIWTMVCAPFKHDVVVTDVPMENVCFISQVMQACRCKERYDQL